MPPAPAARRFVLAAALACAAVAGALLLWNRLGYWNYSDGVYAYSARAVLHGRELYGQLAAAQPPPIYYAGAAVLAIADSPWSLRVALSVLATVSGCLVALYTLRLTRSVPAALVTGVAALLTPWALKGDSSWVPESFAAPLVLGAAGLAAGRGRAAAVGAGVLAALAAGFKLAYLLPAIAVVLAARDRAVAALAAAGVLAIGTAAAFAVWGTAVWDGVVTAQRESGARGLGEVARMLGEGAWNAGAVFLLAALAWRVRDRIADPRLAVALAAAAAGASLTLVTLAKVGSYHNVLVVAELPALPLAAAAVVDALRGAARAPAVLAAALVAFLVGQSVSILRSPADPAPVPSPGGTRQLGDAAVRATVAAARRCGERAYSWEPYPAFVGRRRMPGDQPDQFIVARPVYARLAAIAAADVPRCP